MNIKYTSTPKTAIESIKAVENIKAVADKYNHDSFMDISFEVKDDSIVLTLNGFGFIDKYIYYIWNDLIDLKKHNIDQYFKKAACTKMQDMVVTSWNTATPPGIEITYWY